MNDDTMNTVQAEPVEVDTEPTEPETEIVEESPAITDADILAALENPSEAVKAKLEELIAAGVKKALASATPKRTTVKTEPISKEQFAKMTYKQRCELFERNRPLYEKLKGAM